MPCMCQIGLRMTATCARPREAQRPQCSRFSPASALAPPAVGDSAGSNAGSWSHETLMRRLEETGVAASVAAEAAASGGGECAAVKSIVSWQPVSPAPALARALAFVY